VNRGRRAQRAGSALLVLAAGALLAACSQEATTAKELAPEAAPIPVTVAPVSAVVVERTVPLIGALYANEDVTIETLVEGRIVWLAADMADQVAEGDVLVRLDDAALQADLREVEAQLDKARADSARAQVLRREGIMAKEEADRLRTDAAVLAARRDALKVQIDRAVIRSPLTGAVAERMVSVGEVVKAGDPAYRIVQNDPIKLRTPVPERFAGILRVGEEVRLGVDAYPERVFTGRVTRINPTSENTNRSIIIEALLPNGEGLLKPGFFAKGDLVYDEHGEALAVPRAALTTFAGVTKLFVVANGKVDARAVRTGAVLPNDLLVIEDGVAAGEQVATSNLGRLDQGAAVSAAEQP
jgi:membrane fusion protein, multidrug efflux system